MLVRVASGVIFPYVKTQASIPQGWTRETTMDGRFAKQIATSGTAPGTSGGSDTHQHTSNSHGGHSISLHGHTWPAVANGWATDGDWKRAQTGSSSFGSGGVHNHSLTADTPTTPTSADGPANWTSLNSQAPFVAVIFIKSNGTSVGVPNGCIAFSTAVSPPGWGIADGAGGRANATNRLFRGALAGADGGTTGGSGETHSHTMNHDHAIPDHTHVLAVTAAGSLWGVAGATSGANEAAVPHTHSIAASGGAGGVRTQFSTDGSTTGDETPPWQKVMAHQNTGSSNLFRGMIGLWNGALNAVPAYWQLCDGTKGTPNLCQDKFVRGAASTGEVNTTGGATTHGHTPSGHTHIGNDHFHTVPSTGAENMIAMGYNPADQETNWGTDHGHNSGGNATTTTYPTSGPLTPTLNTLTNAPSFYATAFIQLMVTPANTRRGFGFIPLGRRGRSVNTV